MGYFDQSEWDYMCGSIHIAILYLCKVDRFLEVVYIERPRSFRALDCIMSCISSNWDVDWTPRLVAGVAIEEPRFYPSPLFC